ncbi:MAG: hypothetical protein Alpg2KO_10920 [Alphaproteobacteria bacterium]
MNGLWSRFVRRLKRKLGLADWPYLVIAERQKRGAIHFHVAIHGWHPAQEVREAW